MSYKIESTSYKNEVSTKFYTDAEVYELVSALKDLRNSNRGLSKLCGHDYTCACSDDRAREIIKKYSQ